jgi:hypothetical protein
MDTIGIVETDAFGVVGAPPLLQAPSAMAVTDARDASRAELAAML